jgi:hypothetical protein
MLKSTVKWLNNYVQKLKIRVPKQSRALSKSIKGKVKENNTGVDVEVGGLEYFQYLDQGVNGLKVNRGSQFSYRDKMPPPSAFKAYSNSLGGQFAIAKSIQENGIKPRGFFTDNVEDDFKNLSTSVMEDLWDNFVTNGS